MLPNNKKLFVRLLKGLQKSGKSPAALAKAIVYVWLETSYPHLRRPSSEAALLKDSRVIEFAAWVASLDLMTGAFWLSSAYASLTGRETKKKNSLFFTPPYLSNHILANAGETLLAGKIIDPACGGAAKA